MANSRASGPFKEYATVDTPPDGLGYFTNEVNLRALRKVNKETRVYFSIREYEADSSEASDTSSMVVTLQFKCDGDLGWQDYVPLDGSALAVGNRVMIEDAGAGVLWRAGVKDYEYTSGSITFGFDW
ncbi:MAG: hypothetical protein KJ556_21260 [Gammaproteobacteria bacterium]|nr:hypothetical protein [Gammaproteobacteria bacterium]MBU2685545.1 hypothetical protein [Gammaproteobacteria bacterium]